MAWPVSPGGCSAGLSGVADRKLNKVTMLALAALLDLATNASDGPLKPTLQLRALLALLYSRSDRRREPYASFWDQMTREERGVQQAYVRRTYGVTHWHGIVRSLGGDPELLAFHQRMRAIIEEHDRDQSADGRARRLLAQAIKEAALTREIIATKGQPHSAEAWALIRERRAAGLTPDGEKIAG